MEETVHHFGGVCMLSILRNSKVNELKEISFRFDYLQTNGRNNDNN